MFIRIFCILLSVASLKATALEAEFTTLANTMAKSYADPKTAAEIAAQLRPDYMVNATDWAIELIRAVAHGTPIMTRYDEATDANPLDNVGRADDSNPTFRDQEVPGKKSPFMSALELFKKAFDNHSEVSSHYKGVLPNGSSVWVCVILDNNGQISTNTIQEHLQDATASFDPAVIFQNRVQDAYKKSLPYSTLDLLDPVQWAQISPYTGSIGPDTGSIGIHGHRHVPGLVLAFQKSDVE